MRFAFRALLAFLLAQSAPQAWGKGVRVTPSSPSTKQTGAAQSKKTSKTAKSDSKVNAGRASDEPSDFSFAIGAGIPVLVLPSLGGWFLAKWPEQGLGLEASYGLTTFDDPEFSFSGPSYSFGLRYYPGKDAFYLMTGYRQRVIQIEDPEQFQTMIDNEVVEGAIDWRAKLQQSHLTTMIG
jgi:hypothetical protein